MKPLQVADWRRAGAPERVRPERSIPILLVDDQPSNLYALEALLGEGPFSVVKASSGPEALRCMLKQDFALVLLDVLMPGMDGFETAALIHERPQSKHTPIIFITASGINETHVGRGYSLGAVDYLYKPIVPEVLKAKVQVFVDLHEKSARLAASEEALRRQLEEHRKAEEARRESEDKYRGLFSHGSDAIIIYDSGSGRIVDANQAALKLYGYSCDELLHLSMADLRQEAKGRRAACDPEEDAERQVLQCHKKRDGRAFPVEMTLVGIELRGRKLTMALARDATERKRAKEAELLREREQIQRQLVSTISHELRTPIATIKASIETLQRADLGAGNVRPRFMRIIENHANRLDCLVEDLLTVAELESSKLKPEPRRIGLRAFAQLFVQSLVPLARRKGVSLQVDIREEVEVLADQAHLVRIFQNLIDNAIKYNRRKGSVRVECVKGDRHARISVRDTGIGIPAADLSSIFQQFHRTENAKELSIRGSGLGLYIVKTIVETNGGRIWAESEQGEGSTFHFTLPLAGRLESAAR